MVKMSRGGYMEERDLYGSFLSRASDIVREIGRWKPRAKVSSRTQYLLQGDG